MNLKDNILNRRLDLKYKDKKEKKDDICCKLSLLEEREEQLYNFNIFD